jgi:CRISPR-associated exonuclease Cas4
MTKPINKTENNGVKPTLKDYIQGSFLKVLEKESIDSLGDRSKYIGASDVGGCPYKTIKSKLEKPEYDIEKHIVFQRGHLAEDLVGKMLNGLPYERQVALEGDIDGFPLIAHLDFLIKAKNRSVIVEVKTVSSKVDEAYESWILQVQFQMGLLLNKIQDENHEVEAYIIAIDLNKGWFEVFKQDFSDDLFLVALNKAEHLSSCLTNGVEPKAIIQNYCGDCPYVMECPKQGKFAKEMPEDIKNNLIKIKQHKKEAKAIKLLEDGVKDYLINTGLDKVKLEGDIEVMVSCKETISNRFDTPSFKKAYPDLAAEYTKESSSFRMTIS